MTCSMLVAASDVSNPLRDFGSFAHIQISVTAKKKTLPPIEKRNMRPEEVLDLMLPPREWVEQGKHFMQRVSHDTATRISVARLREMLD